MEDLVIPGMTRNNMPELPEVETVKATLHELVHGKKISDVKIIRAKNVENDPEEFKNALIGATITHFERVGKFIIFRFDKDIVLISHLRMEGKYFLKKKDDPIGKHDLVVFYFTDGTCLMYNDTRRFGMLKVSSVYSYMKEPPLSNVGPDPFMMKDASRLEKAFKNKKIAIKTALLDQSIMSGLGNIYVDEVLFATAIHPETPAYLIKRQQLEWILKESRRILGEAIHAGGTTIKSYHPREGVSGNFQYALQVYGKKDKPCPRCGHLMRKIFVNGRGTTFCPKCQKNIDLPYVVGVTGPIGSGKSEACKYLESLGFLYLSADKIVHDLYKDKKVQDGIKKIIPELKIDNGDIDREFLKNYLLDNPNKKRRLEKYVHAQVEEVFVKAIKSTPKSKSIVLEVPLLFESRIDDYCNDTLFIDVSEKKQIENLVDRNENFKKALKLNQNFNYKENKKKATYVVGNDKDIAHLNKELAAIFSYK